MTQEEKARAYDEALRYAMIYYKEGNEIDEDEVNKEYYLENIIDPKNYNNIDINSSGDFENNFIDYKRKSTFNSNFSSGIINENDNNINNDAINNLNLKKSHIMTNKFDNFKRKSTLLTNLYGGINHL